MSTGIERVQYHGWQEAYRISNGSSSMVAVADVGPRILSFAFNDGPNILFEDPAGKYFRKDWRFYGGHRFWVGPETENAFHPENAPCRADVLDARLVLTQPPDPMGLQRRLEIEACAQTGGFRLRHFVENVGGLLFSGAIWTLTCAIPYPVVIPWGAGSESWQCNMVRYWARWERHRTDPAGGQWHPAADHFYVTPTEKEGKIGLYTEQKFIALLRSDSTFVKIHTPIPHTTYPDGGCNVELYSCDAFVELETLSPMMTFHPGNTYCHEERWILLRQSFTRENWREIEPLVTLGDGSYAEGGP